jgi:hypothetical protein
MKKAKPLTVVTILISVIFIASSIQAGPTSLKTTSSLKTTMISYSFSTPELQENNGFITLKLPETANSQFIPGQPVLPVLLKTIEFPLGTHIKNIQYTISQPTETQLFSKITPGLKPVQQLDENTIIQIKENKDIYTNDAYFPDCWFSYRLTGGLNRNNKETTFLSIQLNPVRYNPVQNLIQSIDVITLEITYEEPTYLFASTTDAYNLLIISYDSYASLLDPLITHKISHGIQTKLVSLKDIYDATYFPVTGTDNQEKIKYFIKNAKENWNVTYVMLVGNFEKIPVRYAALETDKGGAYEELRFASDLYYADIYDSDGNFSNWDTDGDGIYAEWPYPESHIREDIVDLSPDVHVGRLACMFKSEVKTMINKIIDYENNAHGSDWFNRMVVVGGDTFDKSWEGGTNYNEGEIATEKALEFMPGFTPVKIWTSLDNMTTKNIHKEISAGAGFLYFCGHGSPQMWATHNNGDYVNWTGEFSNMDMLTLTNKGKYPILMVGGCHNSEIDVTPRNFITGLLKEKLHYFSSDPENFGSFWKYNWVPECWSWMFVKVRGGAIASMGSVGYGGVNIGDTDHNDIPDCLEGADGWFETQFFRLYKEEGIDYLGQTYSQVVTNYVNNFAVNTNRYDAKIVENHILLGDPSLKIGGYE